MPEGLRQLHPRIHVVGVRRRRNKRPIANESGNDRAGQIAPYFIQTEAAGLALCVFALGSEGVKVFVAVADSDILETRGSRCVRFAND